MGTDEDHLVGFEELLNVAGRVFEFGTEHFRGLVRRMNPENEAFDLTPGDDDRVIVSGLKSDVPAEVVKIGASFTDSEDLSYP